LAAGDADGLLLTRTAKRVKIISHDDGRKPPKVSGKQFYKPSPDAEGDSNWKCRKVYNEQPHTINVHLILLQWFNQEISVAARSKV
jgi:hypothetical protein